MYQTDCQNQLLWNWRLPFETSLLKIRMNSGKTVSNYNSHRRKILTSTLRLLVGTYLFSLGSSSLSVHAIEQDNFLSAWESSILLLCCSGLSAFPGSLAKIHWEWAVWSFIARHLSHNWLWSLRIAYICSTRRAKYDPNADGRLEEWAECGWCCKRIHTAL